jgi:Ca2+-binding RTX toxin-like protein
MGRFAPLSLERLEDRCHPAAGLSLAPFPAASAFAGGAILLEPSTLAVATVGIPYAQAITATGGTGATTLAVSGVSGLVPGVTVTTIGNAVTVIGDPLLPGTLHFTVTATDAANDTASQQYVVTANTLNLAPSSLPAGNAEWPYSQTITALGGSGTTTLTVRNVSGSIAGLDIPSSGTQSLTIAGTPTATGTVTFEVDASDQGGNTASNTYTLKVNPAVSNHLSVSAPLQAVATGLFNISVSTLIPDGGVDTTYQGSVALSISAGPAGGKLAGVLVEPVINGVATFSNLALNRAGHYAILAASTGDLMATTATLPVVPPPRFKVTMATVSPGDNVAGQPFNVTITAQVSSKIDRVYVGTVSLSSSDPQIALLNRDGIQVAPTTVTFGLLDHNRKTVQVYLQTVGRQSVSVADMTLPTDRATSNSMRVTSPLPVKLLQFFVTGIPQEDLAGTPHKVTIRAVDIAGRTVPTYAGTVTVTSSDPAFVPFDIPFTAANRGVVHTMVTLSTPGMQTLTAADGSGSGDIGSEFDIHVVSPANHIAVSSHATTVPAGTQVTVTVTGMAGKTPDALFSDLLQVATSDPRTFVAATPIINGVQHFTVTFETAGPQTITILDRDRPSILGRTQRITVKPAGAAQVVITSAPIIAVAGTVRMTVTAEDAFGNRVSSGFTDTVTLDGVPYTFKPRDRGQHAFALSLAAGPQSVTATDGIPTVASGTAANLLVVSTPVSLVTEPLLGSALIVVTPPAGGRVVITPATADGKTVAVRINGKPMPGTFTPSAYIVVYGQGGHDTITEATALIAGKLATITTPAIILGGTGNNTLSAAGSSVGNALVGGGGKDLITGGTGRDVLIGAGGPDTLNAGSGGSILVAGSTGFDTNVVALATLLAAWDSDAPYAERVHTLFSIGAPGTNPPTVLDASVVFADSASAQLKGGTSGDDWYWFSTDDRVVGYQIGEIATLI